jgi:hypothetical protein
MLRYTTLLILLTQSSQTLAIHCFIHPVLYHFQGLQLVFCNSSFFLPRLHDMILSCQRLDSS